MEEILNLLALHKCTLLDTVRTSEKEIDYLDFLCHQIRKKIYEEQVFLIDITDNRKGELKYE